MDSEESIIILLPCKPEATRLFFFLKQLMKWKKEHREGLEKDVLELTEEDRV